MTERNQIMHRWLQHCLRCDDIEVQPASEDASFRRYFRATTGERSYIVMDAPPQQEDCRPFMQIANRFRQIGLNVPEVLASDLQQGFLLLTDLGRQLYLPALNEDSVERLYGDALNALMVLQSRGPRDAELPPYDRALLRREMALFRDWLLDKHLHLAADAQREAMLDTVFTALEDAALAQPRVCVHRDYHSRNLMVTTRNNPGILDFQDAVIGPVTYDLVSLLRDCYIAWPRARVEEWALGYHDLAVQSGVLRATDARQFLRWFDWMGVQRHLKAAGIFARLWHRDGKAGFLADIPRTLGYVVEVGAGYPELHGLSTLIESEVLPALAEAAA